MIMIERSSFLLELAVPSDSLIARRESSSRQVFALIVIVIRLPAHLPLQDWSKSVEKAPRSS